MSPKNICNWLKSTNIDYPGFWQKASKVQKNLPKLSKYRQKTGKCLQKINTINQYWLYSLLIGQNIQKVNKKWQKFNFNGRKSTTGYKNGEKSTKHRLLWKKSTKVTQYSYKINKSEKRYRPNINKTWSKLTEMDTT